MSWFKKEDVKVTKNAVLHNENGPAVYMNNGEIQEYWINGELHRKDGPALDHGWKKEWRIHGKLHRIGGPAYSSDKTQEYWVNGLPHRTDGPAIIDSDGTKEYWILGKQISRSQFKKLNFTEYHYSDGTISKFEIEDKILHRVNGPAILQNNNKFWFQNNLLHREDGPAIELANGTVDYYQNGQIHNVLGPAVIYATGNVEYWIKGVQYSKEEWHENLVKNEITSRIFARLINNKLNYICNKLFSSKFISNLFIFAVSYVLCKIKQFENIANEMKIYLMADAINLGLDKILVPEVKQTILLEKILLKA